MLKQNQGLFIIICKGFSSIQCTHTCTCTTFECNVYVHLNALYKRNAQCTCTTFDCNVQIHVHVLHLTMNEKISNLESYNFDPDSRTCIYMYFIETKLSCNYCTEPTCR